MPLGGFSLPKRPIFQECWVRQRGREDDADAAPNNAPAADAPRAAPAANGPHDFKTWQSNMAEDIERSDMGHVAEDLKKHRSWFGILFFYHSKLPTKFPQVSNARLHAGWQTIHNKSMDAAALPLRPMITTTRRSLGAQLSQHI